MNDAVVKNVSGRAVSNTSQAVDDPLFDDGLIFGKVYVDLNENGVQDEGEVELAGTGRGEIITTDTLDAIT